MPTARYSSSSSALWPAYYPPALRSLSDPRPYPEPAKLPPSVRYRNHDYHRSLQDDLDDLDNDEDNHYNQVSRHVFSNSSVETPETSSSPSRQVYDLRQYGHSWLVPLGRQRTHDEEVDVRPRVTAWPLLHPFPDSPLSRRRPFSNSHSTTRRRIITPPTATCPSRPLSIPSTAAAAAAAAVVLESITTTASSTSTNWHGGRGQ